MVAGLLGPPGDPSESSAPCDEPAHGPHSHPYLFTSGPRYQPTGGIRSARPRSVGRFPHFKFEPGVYRDDLHASHERRTSSLHSSGLRAVVTGSRAGEIAWIAPDRTRRGQSLGRPTQDRSSIAGMRASEKGVESRRPGGRMSRWHAGPRGREGTPARTVGTSHPERLDGLSHYTAGIGGAGQRGSP